MTWSAAVKLAEVRRFGSRAWDQRLKRPYPVFARGELGFDGPFVLDWRGLASEDRDTDGVVVTRSGGLTYTNPVAVAFRVLADDQHIRLGTSSAVAAAASLDANARRLAAMQLDDGSWRYPVGVARYGVEPGWASGMAQMLGAAALARAGETTGRGEWMMVAARAARFGLVSTADGGCTDYGRSERPFIEECPGGNRCSLPFVFNGAAIALLGLRDLAERNGDHDALEAACAGAARLHDALFSWDTGTWTRYDLFSGAPASPDYHRLHVSLVSALGQQFPGANWAAVEARWRGYGETRGATVNAMRKLATARLAGP